MWDSSLAMLCPNSLVILKSEWCEFYIVTDMRLKFHTYAKKNLQCLINWFCTLRWHPEDIWIITIAGCAVQDVAPFGGRHGGWRRARDARQVRPVAPRPAPFLHRPGEQTFSLHDSILEKDLSFGHEQA